MDGTGEHYAKWNKPGGERQIPYDLTYKWYLIKKTNKWAKQNQRHGNKKQIDSDKRGGCRGERERSGRLKPRNMNKGPHGHGQWEGMDYGSGGGMGQGSGGEEGGTTVTEQQ